MSGIDRTAKIRAQRRRDRIRRRVCCVMVEIGETEIDTLTEAGHLSDADAADPFKIAIALKRMITRDARP
jgi:uncharacterized tellurite resistance protein B-like protein